MNQAIGRAIRNTDDYAAVLLMDQRYLKEDNLRHLSKWFTDCLRPASNSYQDIASFLKAAATDHRSALKAHVNSTKNNKSKHEASICERLLEFSTPSKSHRKKMKLKFES